MRLERIHLKSIVAILFVGIAPVVISGNAHAANVITFKNDGTPTGPHDVYVEVVAGTCDSPLTQRVTTRIGKGATQSIVIPGGKQKSACWIASTFPTVAEFPLYCGNATVDSTVLINKTNKVCDLKLNNAKGLNAPSGTETKQGNRTHLEYSLTSWNDPFTPPHTKTDCDGYASGHWPWCDDWKTCNHWSTQCQYMRNEAFLVIDADSPTDLKTIVDHCLQQSACAAALAGVTAAIITGGAALPAAEQAFIDVMIACLTGEATAIQINFDIRTHWTPYGSC